MGRGPFILRGAQERAPQDDGIDMDARSRSASARGPAAAKRPSFAKSLPSKTEGAGKAGCALHPRSRVQSARKKTHTSIQVQRRASGLPCAMALRLIARSPRRRIPLVTVACGLRLVQARLGRRISASLTSATDARTTRLRRTQQPVFANRLRRALAPFVCALTDRSREIRPAMPFRADAAASTASQPAFVTIATRPSFG
jgi:hypothetical protein